MGIVHHSNYPVWFELGRTDYIRQIGLPYSRIEEEGLMLPLIELKCSYFGSSTYEDEILVKTSISESSLIRLKFRYEVFKNGGSDAITVGETTHVWTTKDLKPVNIKKYRPSIHEFLYKYI
jgi:acyl-CoA thioester hydrolase